MCGVAGCNANWDPTQNLLAFVAGSSTDTVGFSIQNSSVFQGAIYAVNDYSEENGSDIWGPIIARQVILAEQHDEPLRAARNAPRWAASDSEEASRSSNESGSLGLAARLRAKSGARGPHVEAAAAAHSRGSA